MPKLKYLEGIGLLVGMIFGAGVFALPFSIAQAGIFWGLVHFGIAFSLIVFLHLLYSEVAYSTEGRHRLTGYTRIYLGKKAERLMFLATIFSYYGTLLVYGILAGIFLSNIFPKVAPEIFSLLFFLAGAFLILLRLSKIGLLNFFLTLPLFGFVLYLFFVAWPVIKPANFQLFNNNNFWFLPFGVWLFSLTGFSIIPEVRDLFSRNSLKNFKKVVLFSILITALFYFIFVFSIIGAAGEKISQDALSGLIPILGFKAVLAGSLLGLLAVFTSLLALAQDFKDIFRYDYKLPFWLSWILVVGPPIILFFSGFRNFISLINVIGIFGFGLSAIFIIFMFRKQRTKK